MNESLISINVCVSDNVINKMPLLFYWNGEGDMIDSLKDGLKKYMDEKNIIDSNTYGDSFIYYFKILINKQGKEFYEEDNIAIQNIYKLNELDLNLSYTIIYKICLDLYKKCYKSNFNDIYSDKVETINYIYNNLRDKYKEKLSKLTFINYIRSEIVKTYKLNEENVNYIITIINTLLNKET